MAFSLSKSISRNPLLGAGGFGLLGGGLGALLGSNQGSFFRGRPQSIQQASLLEPDQQDARQALLAQGLQNFDFGNIEQKARRDFQRETIPTLMERFSSLGAGRGDSSALRNALAGAGTNLEENLAAQRFGLGEKQLGFGFQQPFQNIVNPQQVGFGQKLPEILAQLAPLLARLYGGV